MRDRSPLGLVAILLLVALYVVRGQGCQVTPLPSPSPPPADAPNLVEAFATNNNRTEAIEHARSFAALCDELASCLEYDGSLTTPRLRTGVAFDDLRRAAREAHFRGKSLRGTYPGLATALNDYFTAKVGTSGNAVHPEQRRKWVEAFRATADAAEYAASRG